MPPPTLWVLGRNDPLVPPDDQGLQCNWYEMDQNGIDRAVYINEPNGARIDAFTRIANPSSQVSLPDSIDAVSQMKSTGLLDACVPAGSSASLNLGQVTLGPSFYPAGCPNPNQDCFVAEAIRQLDELFAAHEFTSDFKAEVVAFFAAHP